MYLRLCMFWLSLFVFCSAPAFSDVLILQNGDKFTGQITNIDLALVQYQIPINPQPLQISWAKIKSLKAKSSFMFDLGAGENISGAFDYTSKSGFKIRSKKAGAFTLAASQIHNIQMLQTETPKRDLASTEAGQDKAAAVSNNTWPLRKQDRTRRPLFPTMKACRMTLYLGKRLNQLL